MGYPGTHWPEGLNDEEALQCLQTLCLGACDGIQDLADDTRYKALRRALLGRTDLRALAPAFVAAQLSLEAFVRHARETKDRTLRREMVREQFKALWDEVRGPDAVSSATWTGRPSLREHAAVIQALAPVALDAVQRLIDDEELARDNGGPVDADRAVALQQLKALHGALARPMGDDPPRLPIGVPARRRLRGSERQAIHRSLSVAQLADRGTAFPAATLHPDELAQADDPVWRLLILADPWAFPASAFGDHAGPP